MVRQTLAMDGRLVELAKPPFPTMWNGIIVSSLAICSPPRRCWPGAGGHRGREPGRGCRTRPLASLATLSQSLASLSHSQAPLINAQATQYFSGHSKWGGPI